MKKYLKPALALVLVAALAIGGTLAYLTDSTETYVNDFTVDETVDIELTENYEDFTLTPGSTQEKDPTVTVLADESYVFIEVVETIPTAALGTSGTQYTFASYVDYSINGLYGADPLVAGGTVYLYDSATKLPAVDGTNWYWQLVETSTSAGTDEYDNETGDTYTTTTYVYALVNANGDLLTVSSLDGSVSATAPTTGTEVEYPILTDDEVSIPTTVTSAMMELLAVTGPTTDEYYTVDLAFTGYAIQTANLVYSDTGADVTDYSTIYRLAKGEEVKEPTVN